MPMQRVVQKHSTGCGIACIAVLTGKSYDTVLEEAKNTLSVSGRGRNGFRTRRGQLRCLAKAYRLKLGCKTKFDNERNRSIADFENDMNGQDIGCHAIFAINRRKGAHEWHWVVWDNAAGRILDPRKKPDDEFRPWYYMRVARKRR